ncbi:hypothetical protein QWZ04_23115 [Vibrio tapetis subsp. quintayensis]|uniref:hypothetical protein n=1 Tax=Vibrio tapetis TaxID=52443 RepID=UPI0025B53474|nr:hypothetical protein [Vibrio tapetis]MDN3683201.1 hypothetical protein [Vibrio tapetis subsp. quintayensis]
MKNGKKIDNTTSKNNVLFRNKQRGAISLEAIIILGFVTLALIAVISQVPNLITKFDKFMFNRQAGQITESVRSWKKMRPNYDGVTIPKVCADGELSKSVCGTANDGKGTNPFGGDWTLTANAATKGFYDLTGTLPGGSEHIASLADSMAASTRGNCIEASGCATIKTTANSITMTY